MKLISTTLKLNSFFYLTSLLFLLVSALLLSTVSKAGSFIALNGFHSLAWNDFFEKYTFLGDGLFSLLICVFFYYRKQKELALYILVAYLSSGIATQVLKHLIHAPRPKIYFEANHYLFQMDNFRHSCGGKGSFPSGHTTSAFALATILAIYFKNRSLTVVIIMGALLVGYSRIYLGQHFPIDVLVGAFIGTIFATFSYVIIKSNIKWMLSVRILNNKLNWNRGVPNTALS